MKKARLVLEDGTEFFGESFGAPHSTSGEVVFNTAVSGYCETLTDPSCIGQILTMTWPIFGAYGVPPLTEEAGMRRFFESNRIWPRGLVVTEYSPEYSHWNAVRSLGDWLREEDVPAITGIDTRALAKKIRDQGTMLGKIVIEDEKIEEFSDPIKSNLIAEVSCREIIEYVPETGRSDANPTIVLLDCGTKNSTIRALLDRGANVVRVPWDYDFADMPYDGLLISDGPGDPHFAEETVANIKKAFEIGKPIFGIGMGHLLLGRAAGAEAFRLRFGHHGHNQPVVQCNTDRAFVTNQHHTFALDPLRLSTGWEEWFVNLNDGSCEGIRHKHAPFFGVQFSPNLSEGSKNAENFYETFFSKLK